MRLTTCFYLLKLFDGYMWFYYTVFSTIVYVSVFFIMKIFRSFTHTKGKNKKVFHIHVKFVEINESDLVKI